jgi:lipopolysaccharide/colanic/teichoic acid biosynthesis glycosyltransferase
LELALPARWVRSEGDLALVERRRIKGFAKRALDLGISVPALVALMPVMLLVAIALLLTQGRPILFRQRRPGLAGDQFTIVKFRTMRAPRAGEDRYRTDRDRVTKLGRWLRATSLDELPELWNVVRGEMSLVGPRPLLTEYLASYTPRQSRRHDVRPGVTSWAIVHGRHSLTFEERLELDVWYVEHWSIGLDVRILWMTARQLLRRGGVAVTQDIDRVGFPIPPDGSGSGSSRTVGPSDE